jgi:transposase
MKFTSFIGIDVSKNHLDLCLIIQKEEITSLRIENTEKAWKETIREFKKIHSLNLKETLFCLESTGSYSNPSLFGIHKLGGNIWMELPIHIKKSIGFTRGKSDEIDARRIAWYAHDFQRKSKLWSPPRPILQKLKQLTSLRIKLVRSKNQYQCPNTDNRFIQDKEMAKLLKKTNDTIIKVFQKQILDVDKQIKSLIKEDEKLRAVFEIITSVSGIGWITGVDFIINTNEFSSITCPKKYACYSGVAPFENSSGSSIRKGSHVSHFANKNSKRLLHLAAMSAIVMKGELQNYYLRKITQGKTKMTALNAVRNKLILRVFSCVKRNEKYIVLNE